jgi:hypothetical protein
LIFRRPVLDRGPVMKRPLVCRVCLDRDDVESASVVEHRCINEHTGKDFTAHVCARCLEVRRETRVTCRTFIPGPAGAFGSVRFCGGGSGRIDRSDASRG